MTHLHLVPRSRILELYLHSPNFTFFFTTSEFLEGVSVGDYMQMFTNKREFFYVFATVSEDYVPISLCKNVSVKRNIGNWRGCGETLNGGCPQMPAATHWGVKGQRFAGTSFGREV
jgi:hypothetical protein